MWTNGGQHANSMKLLDADKASSMFFKDTSQRMKLIWTLVTVLPRVEYKYKLNDLKSLEVGQSLALDPYSLNFSNLIISRQCPS